jgi:two-component system, chemotaxis family, chemotaxis protein CheY
MHAPRRYEHRIAGTGTARREVLCRENQRDGSNVRTTNSGNAEMSWSASGMTGRNHGTRKSSKTGKAQPPLVLLVDDDKDNREMYAIYLRANGFQVSEACDGMEAVAVAKKLRPGVVVLDLNMPRVGGLETIRRIRRLARIRHTPILVVTADDSQQQDAMSAGADAVCVKLCVPADLVSLIQRVLQRASL